MADRKSMFRFESLEIWREAVEYASRIYSVTSKFPASETYALSDQLRRAAVSISANIAEGSGSASAKDLRNYLSIAIKSVFETVSLLKIAERNRYISNREYADSYTAVETLVKKIQSFRNSLRK